MNTQRDELAELIANSEYPNMEPPWPARKDRSPVKWYSRKTADAVLAAGYRKPRIITGPEDLRGLGCGSVVHCTGDLTGEGDGDQTLICDIAPNRVSHLIWRNHWMRITTPALFQSYETITVLREQPTA